MKHIRLFGLLGLLIGLMVAAAGCTSGPQALETEADFTGFITEIHSTAEEDRLGRILVESHADKLVDKYVVTIKDETLIFKQEEENRRQVAFETLETTQQIQVWFTEPILESFPMQVMAQQIVIIPQQHTGTYQTPHESAIRSPYVGQETRGIKALSQDDVEGLLAGAGSPFGGLAKPAELNGYPGPRHVLDAVKAGEFELINEQQEQIEALYEEMRNEAIELGKKIIDIERAIDDAFQSKSITEGFLQEKLSESANLYGQLRFVHLRYHLSTAVDILTPQQIEQYNELRGYTSGDPCEDVPEGHDPEMWKSMYNCD